MKKIEIEILKISQAERIGADVFHALYRFGYRFEFDTYTFTLTGCSGVNENVDDLLDALEGEGVDTNNEVFVDYAKS